MSLSMIMAIGFFKSAKSLFMTAVFGALNHCQTTDRVCSNLFRFLLPFSSLSAIEDDVIDDLLAARVCSNLFSFSPPIFSALCC